MTMGIDDFSTLAGSAPGLVKSLASSFVASLALDSVTGPALGVVANCVTLIMIESTKSNYFYKKQITIEDLTSFKLYIKKTILIEKILFGETDEA